MLYAMFKILFSSRKYLLSFLMGIICPLTALGQSFSTGQVVVRLKSGSENVRTSQFESVLNTFTVKSRHFVNWSDPKSRSKHPLSDLYLVDVPTGISVDDWLKELQKSEAILYAEPYIEHELLYTPNDPQATLSTGQDYLAVVKAFDAWSITRGSSSIVIGILDSGNKLDHEDLIQQIAVNSSDPIDGIDNDQDGYLDNYWGWDMADFDNNPTTGLSGHGTFVTGVAAAKPDNAKGMAGIGFNSTFMPIKIYKSSDNRFRGGYEAIAYAADMGCQVINLSWGSAGSYLQYAQDIINYAVLEKDVIIVAAAGNTNADLDFYPASYDNVLSVGATDMQDKKAVWATYSGKIDLVAPGHQILSSNFTGTYSKDNGSSFSAPMVAGAAALVRAKFPNLSAQQIMERIRVTSDDNIYQIPENLPYIDKLGHGRLNVYRALTDEGIRSVRLTGFDLNNNYANYAFAGDTLELSLELKNWLSLVGGLRISIESKSDFAHIIGDYKNVGTLSPLATASLNNAFKIVLDETTPINSEIQLKVIFEGNGYQDYQYISFYASPESANIPNQKSILTINKNAHIGNGTGVEDVSFGLFHNQKKVADHIGLIVATASDKVSDNAINSFAGQIKSDDFEAQELLTFNRNSSAYFDIRNVLKEKSGLSNKTGLLIEQKLLAWPDKTYKNAWVIEYRVTNTSSSPISNVYIGNLMDINIGDQSKNKIDYQTSRKLMYGYGVNGEPIYVGLAPLNSVPLSALAIDLASFNGNSADITSTIDDAAKYNLLQQGENLNSTRAGINGLGNDIATLMGNKITTLPAYSSTKLAYVYISGNSLDDLEDGYDTALLYYNQYLSNPQLSQTFYACPNTSISIDPSNGDRFDFYADKNATQKLFTGNQFETGTLSHDTIFYIQNVDNLYKSDISAIKVLVKDAIANFDLPTDTLILPASGGANIEMIDLSQNISIWNWNFGNGFQSTLKNPKITYSQSGIYNIVLTAQTAWGCEDVSQKTLVVLRQAITPELPDEIRICNNNQVLITAANSNHIRVYSDSQKQNLLYEGSSYLSPILTDDLVFYVSNMDGEAESDLKVIFIDVLLLTADFEALPDTTNLASRSAIKLINKSINGNTFQWYINNQLKSQISDPVIDFGGLTSFDLKLVTQSESGCETENTIHFDQTNSTIPQLEDFSTCPNTAVIIKPNNGEVFYFYADTERQQLLHKGKSITINPNKDTSIYISNADGLIESDLIKVDIELYPIDASISQSETLDVIGLGTRTFTANDLAAKSWLWKINNQIVSTKNAFEYNFLLKGLYTLQLTVTTQEDCEGSSEISFTVDEILSSPDNLNSGISIYPNPNHGILEIGNADNVLIRRIRVISVSGQEVYNSLIQHSDTKIVLDLQQIQPGLYFLELETTDKKIYQKVQIER